MRLSLRRLVQRLPWREPIVAQPNAPYPDVSLIYWQPQFCARNFGDHLSRVIAGCVAAEHSLTFDDEVAKPRRMLAIGSILHLAQPGDVVWGSGWNGKIEIERLPSSLDIRAVRGPKTAALLLSRGYDYPVIHGDPALLTRRYFGNRFAVKPQGDFIVIPNLNDLELARELPNVVSPLLGWNRVISAIVKAPFVISSSLHGLILAETFGVPARLLKLSDAEPQFKFDDYGQGTGRDHLERARTINEALRLGEYAPPVFDEQALIKSFPVDLWGVD